MQQTKYRTKIDGCAESKGSNLKWGRIRLYVCGQRETRQNWLVCCIFLLHGTGIAGILTILIVKGVGSFFAGYFKEPILRFCADNYPLSV